MADKISFNGKVLKRGTGITKGAGWRLIDANGTPRYFVGTVLETFTEAGGTKIVIFRVRKNPSK